MKSLIAMAVVVSAAFLGSVPAHAIRGEGVNLSVIRHQDAQKRISTIRVEGALRCDFAGNANNGQGCALRITESKSGRSFNIIEPQAARASVMRLYLDGTRNVAIEGHLADGDTIQVKDARTL